MYIHTHTYIYIYITLIVNIRIIKGVHPLQRGTVNEIPTSVLFHSDFFFLLPCIPVVMRSIYYRLPLIHP